MKFKQYLEEQIIIEKKKFSVAMNPKKMDDDTLMDWISWLENVKEPNSDNEDQRKKSIKDGQKEMKKRGFK